MNGLIMKAKETIAGAKAGIGAKALTTCAAASTLAVGFAVPAFASSGGSSLPTIAITTDMLKPLVDGVIANIGAILPIGLGLFAFFLGIRIIPGLISSFVRMR